MIRSSKRVEPLNISKEFGNGLDMMKVFRECKEQAHLGYLKSCKEREMS